MESWAVFEISQARCLHLNHLPEATKTYPIFSHQTSELFTSTTKWHAYGSAQYHGGRCLAGAEESSRRDQPNARAVVGKSASDSAVDQGPCIADLFRPHLFARALDDAVLPDMSSSTTTAEGPSIRCTGAHYWSARFTAAFKYTFEGTAPCMPNESRRLH